MATQEYISLSQPLFEIDPTYFTQRVMVDEKKQKKRLVDLGAILKLVEEEVSQVKGRTRTVGKGEKLGNLDSSNNSAGPSNTAFEDAMAEMTRVLELLQVKLAKYGNQKGEMDSLIAKAQIKLAQEKLQDTIEQVQKMEQAEKAQKALAFWMKFAEGIIGGVSIIAGALLAQPELMVIGALSIAASAGLFDDASKGLASAMEGLGCPQKIAEAVSSAVVCGVTILASILLCNPAAAAEEVAETAGETAEAVSSNVASVAGAAEKAEEEASTLGQAWSKVKNFVSSISPRVRVGAMSAMTALSNTQIVQKITDDIAQNMGASKEERKKIEEAIGIIMTVVTLIVSALAGLGSANSSTSVDAVKMLSGDMAKIIGTGMVVFRGVGTVGQSSGAIAQGGITTYEGRLQQNLFNDQAQLDLLKTIMDMNSDETSSSQRQIADSLQNERVGNRTITQLMRGYEAFANNAVYHSPV